MWDRLTTDQKLDIAGWVLFFLALLTILSFISAQRGALPEWWISVLSQTFGWGMYVVPLFFGGVGLWLILRRFEDRLPKLDPEQIIGVVIGFFVALTTLHLIATSAWPQTNLYKLGEGGLGGGLMGALLLDVGIKALGKAGIILTLVMAWLIVGTFVAGISPADAVRMLSERAARRRHPAPLDISQLPLPPELMTPTGPPPEPKIIGGAAEPAPSKATARPRKKQDDEVPINVAVRPANGNGGIEFEGSSLAVGAQAWRLPSVVDVLEEGSEQYYSEDLIRKQVRVIESTLESLGAPVRVREINQGPVVTQYGAEPLFITSRTGRTTKVKVSKIASLADDLALALSARSIRIQAPIPGKGLVGIEVPNEEPALVSLRDIMESEGFGKLKGRLRLGLGQDVSGQAVAADLRAMPHMLIAGATGAGKSVCVNSIIAALLLQNTPDTLRLLMVDPKRVELTQYNGIPHLLAPVIVDVDRVVPALKWVMREMDSRYRRFAQIGARNIEDFNQRVSKLTDESPIPYIAVLVDELADLMMQAPEETERSLCRLAQMARATGIHLIIATQRPSVDVVTGLIKANFPSRVAFAVASSVDSRVILDMPGAERLLGRGDMLFMPPDVSQPLRLQGAFVSDHELDRLINFWHNAVEPGKTSQPVDFPKPKATIIEEAPPKQSALFPDFAEDEQTAGQFEDSLLPTAVEIFLTENRASVSLLQRRLRIGYTRSARLVEQLADMGVVSIETEGQFRKINRAVGEALLQSLYPAEDET
ncbi:MAG TPA: DNA translocase FtsK 4TM domain-containing protein [Anaerolineae bacterium]|nr:DNA translocase FtsK 4TM domain-containing protein [Anaerolineae bacterium]HQI86607.1 DNA translocase FtsK 4TM domain-containing protein [Anaerolineae bacterium]